MSTQGPVRVVAIVPAKDEAERLGSTLHHLQMGVWQVGAIIVVDDGSTDATVAIARKHGARVERHAKNRGKAAAMMTGAAVAKTAYPEAAVLFVDADLQESAGALGVLCDPVLDCVTDMTIAVLPAQDREGGGFGFVVRLAAQGIEDASGWRPVQPLSGMRCVRRPTLDEAMPLARGWGVEVALTIDVLRAGGRVSEIPCPLQHRVTGKDWHSQVHRARQFRDVWIALALRRRPRPQRLR